MKVKKKRFEKAKHDYKLKYTFIIAPNTYGRTHKFSVSYFWVKNSVFLFGIFLIFFVLLLFSYIGLLANYNKSKQDLLTLQSINKEQQMQLYDMSELAKKVDQKLLYLNLLETKIKKFIDEDASGSSDPYMNEINAKLDELEEEMGATGGNDGAYMNYYVASNDISNFDKSNDLDKIKESLSKVDLTIDSEQSKFEDLQTDVEARSDYEQSFPNFLPVHGTMTDGFGFRTSPSVGFHTGVDIAAPRGTPIQAAARGTVVRASWYSTYGNCVIIDHGYGYKTLYGHMSKILVNEGDVVEKMDVIGLVGSTGFSTGNHLHFEVIENGKKIDPLGFITIEN